MQNIISQIGKEAGLNIAVAKFRGPLVQIAIGIAVLWFGPQWIEGVVFRGTVKDLIIVGSVLGLVNYFLKPVVNLITFPLRMLTLGLFSFAVNMLMVWIVDILFPEFDVEGFIPLFWTAILLWALGFIVPRFFPKKTLRPALPRAA